MSLTINYYGLNRVKYWVSRYLNTIFLAQKKGAVTFMDGANKIEFSKPPMVANVYSWVSRDMPAVIIGPTTAVYEERSFTKNSIHDASLDDTATQSFYGGDIDIQMTLYIRATTTIEADLLTDTVSIFFSKADAKDYFMRQDIKIAKPPAVGAMSAVPEPDTDFSFYEVPVELSLHSTWIEWVEAEERLIDIIVDIEAELDL